MEVQVSQATLVAIQRHLLAKDNSDNRDRAFADLVDVLLEPLVEELSWSCRCLNGHLNRRSDEHFIRDSVTDAFLDLRKNPEKYDASRGVPLDRYLAAAARRNVSDLQRKERRIKCREQRAGRKKLAANVALDPAAANIIQEANESQEQKVRDFLAQMEKPQDAEILVLMVQGVRATASYAHILEIENLPLEQQRREVKRNKDRLKHWAMRHGFGSLFSS